MSEKILITGGSGFIGTELVRTALAKDFEVRNFDIKPPRDASHADIWRAVDIRDAEKLTSEMIAYNPDRVLHLASDIDINITDISQFTTIIDGTRNVLDAIQQIPRIKRFIHTSTQFVVRPGIEPINERHLEPYTVYGEAKAESEKLVWNAELSTQWYIVRPTIIWGPHHPSFASEIFRHLRSGRYLHPRGSKPVVRAFGYVTNVAEQMLTLATKPNLRSNRRVFYLGDSSLDYEMWADAFSYGLTGKPAKRIPIWLLTLLGQAGDLVKAMGIKSPIDSGRAFRMSTSSRIELEPTHQVTGAPRVSFEKGVEETLEWLETVYSSTKKTPNHSSCKDQ